MQLYIMMSILIYLLSCKKVTASTLAKKFEVSTRSIYRYIDALSISGIPVTTDSGRNGGIYIDSDFKLKNMFLTKQEKDQILSCLQQKNDAISITICQKLENLNKE